MVEAAQECAHELAVRVSCEDLHDRSGNDRKLWGI